jgi:hypothetical protein
LESGDCLRPSEHENTTELNCYEPYTMIVDFSPHIKKLLVRFQFVSQLTCSYIYIYIHVCDRSIHEGVVELPIFGSLILGVDTYLSSKPCQINPQALNSISKCKVRYREAMIPNV